MTTPTLTNPETDLLESFLACVCAELTFIGRRPTNCCLVWGDGPPPADFCDCTHPTGSTGHAWVRMIRMDPAATNNRTTTGKCQPMRLRMWVEAGVYRCTPTVADDGVSAPTCTQRSDSARGFLRDARALRTAVACCDALKDHRMEFLSNDPLSISGGCSGTTIQFTLDL